MGETYSIGEFAERYRFRDRKEVWQYVAQGVIKPMRIRGNSRLGENDMMQIVRYNTEKRQKETRLTGR